MSNSNKFIIKYSQRFSSIRVLDTEMFPVWLTVFGDLISKSPIESPEFRLGIAKMDYWFTNIVNNSFMFSLDNEWVLNMDPPLNIPLVSPFEPTDDVLASLFHCKCNALANGAFEVIFCQIEDENSSMSFIYADDEMPDLPKFAEGRKFFDQPWWNRNDSSTFDILPNEDDDINEPPDFFFSLDFLKEQFHGPAEIIRPKFKPIVIPGKKK